MNIKAEVVYGLFSCPVYLETGYSLNPSFGSELKHDWSKVKLY